MPLYKASTLTVAYQEFTAPVTINTNTDATANTIVTAPAFIADGSSSYWVEFASPQISPGASDFIVLVLFEATTNLGRFGSTQGVSSVMGTFSHKVTPAAGSRTYSVRGFRSVTDGTVNAGTWGAASNPPGHIRITRYI